MFNHLRRDFPGNASRVVRFRTDEHYAGLFEVVEEKVHKQKVPQVVNAYSLFETVGRLSRILVLWRATTGEKRKTKLTGRKIKMGGK